MKITFILSTNMITGGYRAIFEIANRLHERGHAVNIVCPLIPLHIEPNFNIQRFKNKVKNTLKNLIKCNDIQWFKVKANIICILSLSPRFVRYFEREIPDSDVIVATAWETAYFVNRLSEKKGAKFYFVQHYEVWDLWNNERNWEKVETESGNNKNIYILMANIIPEDSTQRTIKEMVDNSYSMPLKKITTAFWLKELLSHKFGHKIERITLGLNHNLFYPDSNKNIGKKTVLFPVRSARWKGFLDVVKALQIVAEEYNDINIVTFGEKHISVHLKSLPVKNEGLVYGAKLRRLYSEADIFVFPSWVEGWGLPPMEAMACGTACITTDVGGVPEYTIPGKTAIVVPPREPERLAKEIIYLLKDDFKRCQIADEGCKYIKQFSWDRTTDQIESIFQN
jgi:hypothetical protein